MPFCSNCGQQVQSNNKFCASCGAPLQPAAGPMPNAPPPAYSPPPPPAYPVETVKFVIGGLAISKSWGRSDNYTLIVTERRSIFAKLTQEIMNETVRASRAQAQAEGKGFFGKWAAQMKGFYSYHDRYVHLTPDQILQETPGNFVIENAWISKIKISEYTDPNNNNVEFGITFEMMNQKLYFKSMYDLKDQLRQVYGPAIVH
jgi:hypothetical protein